jgi:hypothetical protein
VTCAIADFQFVMILSLVKFRSIYITSFKLLRIQRVFMHLEHQQN